MQLSYHDKRALFWFENFTPVKGDSQDGQPSQIGHICELAWCFIDTENGYYLACKINGQTFLPEELAPID